MALPPYFEFKEHSSQSNDKETLLIQLISVEFAKEHLKEDNKKYLGLNPKFEANYFIGMRWIEWIKNNQKQKGVIWVKPKRQSISYEQLLWKCLSHPVVCNHLDQCYKIYPDEPAIPLKDSATDIITPLLITDFLVRVQKIVKKGLKKGFVNVEENLNSKIKGKILVNQTIKQQLKKNTITQTHCAFQIHTIDCIENQIIKAALLQSQKYIYRYMKFKGNSNESIFDILNYSLIAFEQVGNVAITPFDFNRVNHSAFYKEYKPALNLAKLILKGLGFSINSDISAKDRTVPPFYIDMPELFERYCEVLLRNQYPDTLTGYGHLGYSETRLGRSKLRPDFIIPSLNMIVDSKYKYWIEGSHDIDGIMQMSLYSRHNKAIEKMKDKDTRIKLQFLYPRKHGETSIQLDKDCNREAKNYPDIFKYPIRI